MLTSSSLESFWQNLGPQLLWVPSREQIRQTWPDLAVLVTFLRFFNAVKEYSLRAFDCGLAHVATAAGSRVSSGGGGVKFTHPQWGAFGRRPQWVKLKDIEPFAFIGIHACPTLAFVIMYCGLSRWNSDITYLSNFVSQNHPYCIRS